MIKEDLKKFLTDIVGVDIEELKTALTSDEEVEVKYTGELYTEAQLESAKESVKTSGKNEWKKTGVEMAVKAARDKYGLEFEGKTIENLADALTSKVLADAKIKPEAQLTELKTSLTNLQTKYESDIELKDNEIQRLASEVNNFSINNKLSGYLPKDIEGITPRHAITLMKADGYEFGDNEDAVFVGKLNGKTIKDPTEKPVPVETIVFDYLKSNNFIKGASGRGGEHEPGGGSKGFKSINEQYKYLDENNIDPGSPEGQKILDIPLVTE